MELTPENVHPASPDPYIREDEDMMLIRLGHYKALVTALETAQADATAAAAAAEIAQETADSAARPYTSYVAVLTQTGSGAPTATVLENSLANITWSRVGAGVYDGTATGAFPASTFSVMASTDAGVFEIFRNTSNTIRIKTLNLSGSNVDGFLSTASVEIRVY